MSLKVRMRCGASWWASRMRCTDRRLTPAASASMPTGPMGRRAGRRPKRKVYHPPYGRGRQRLLSRLARLVTRQPRDAFRHEPGLPAPYHRLRLARAAHNLGSATTVGSGEDNIGAPHMFLRRAAVPDNRLKAAAIGGCHRHDNSCSHAESLNCFERFGNHLNESDH